MNRLLIAAAAVLATTSLVSANPNAKPAKKNAKADLVCPVMGSKIASKEAASGKSVYQGKTYYFCCGGCKPAFDKNPAKYAKADKKTAKPAKHG